MKRSYFTGVACVVLASACYGVTRILSNTALNGGLPEEFVRGLFGSSEIVRIAAANPARAVTNETLVALSMGIACVLSLLSALIGRRKLGVTFRQFMSLSVLGGGALAGTLLLITYAYLRIPPGMTIVINFTYPIFVMVAGVMFFREKARPAALVAVLLAIVGIGLLSLAGTSGTVDALGILIALASGITYAIYFLAGRNSSYASLETAVSNVYITGAASVLALVVALLTSRFSLPTDLFIWGVLFLEALLGYVIGLRLLLAGIRILGSTAASAINTLEPAFASITSMLIFGEAMGLFKGLGILLVLVGALISIILLRSAGVKAAPKSSGRASKKTR